MVAWLGAVGFGIAQIWAYATTPGASNPHPAHWPADSHIARAADRTTLVMFVHPLCTCSVASLAELSGLMRAYGPSLHTSVVFFKPGDSDPSWSDTSTWASARRIPGVDVLTDVDGKEAERFGAATSGQVVLYNAAGELTFAGGLTGSRGHEGDSPGRQRIVAVLQGQRPDRASSNVYGCPIADPEPTP